MASLSTQDINDFCNLDLYVNCTQNLTIAVKGPHEVHLSGYFEPQDKISKNFDDDFDGLNDDNVGDESELKNLKGKAAKKAKKESFKAINPDFSSDSNDEEEGEDES